jgi:predicted RNA binding protein YcfA (HicA-like mRNA interferase family)
LSKSEPHKASLCLLRHVAKLPTDLSGREVRAALERAGFVFRRQTGSHMMLRRDQPYARAIVPDNKQIRSGTLRRIIADAGLTVEQFIELLGD